MVAEGLEMKRNGDGPRPRQALVPSRDSRARTPLSHLGSPLRCTSVLIHGHSLSVAVLPGRMVWLDQEARSWGFPDWSLSSAS